MNTRCSQVLVQYACQPGMDTEQVAVAPPDASCATALWSYNVLTLDGGDEATRDDHQADRSTDADAAQDHEAGEAEGCL